jgi:parallel beta-helix repeat protein
MRSNTTASTGIDKSSYVVLDTIDGAILIEGTKVTSWDFATNQFDTTPKNGRAFLRAYGLARMDVIGSEIAYLGNPDGGGSYGLSYRDQETGPDGHFLARVRGDVIGSDIHHMYYGYFSFAASGVVIRGNKFHDNDSYGFDPHDFSYDFLVEDNESFNNGNHGFIISRGCHSFIFRRNKSYGNVYKVDSKTFRAHGFMLDPGGLTSDAGEYTPSYNVLLENNESYDNQGYGIRVLDANSTTIRSNVFRNNLDGMTIERNSFHNTVQGNQIINNRQSGIEFAGDNSLGHPHNNLIAGNSIVGNAREGIYFNQRTNSNEVRGNDITANGVGIRAIAETRLNWWLANRIWGNPGGPIDITTGVNGSIDPPTIAGVNPTTLAGRAQPGALIDVFSSDDGQAQHYEGRAIADAAGNWQHVITGPWRGARVTAIQTLPSKGSSELAPSVARP